jgi:hypothetical protein
LQLDEADDFLCHLALLEFKRWRSNEPRSSSSLDPDEVTARRGRGGAPGEIQ